MLFVNTKREAERLQDRLNANDFPSRVISGDVEQRKRLNILEQFKRGELPILIATDVASRGLHIDGVSHVINYDLPQDAEDYVHRIGRTARAGAEGKAVSLADEDGAFYVEAIEEYIHTKIPVEWAEDELFVHDFKRPKYRVPTTTAGRPAPGQRHSRTSTKPSTRPAAASVAPSEAKKKSRPRRKKPSGGGTGNSGAPTT